MTFNINFCNLTEILEKEDFIMKLKLLLTKPIVIFFLRTLFYLLIFLAYFGSMASKTLMAHNSSTTNFRKKGHYI
ncbi:Uncharacterised protein [Listeria grayi]|uniref:Uncharacterized protein n=1 Tax=Listeria grayi TaxID=1641 RepID=A0A378MFI1_LISGR|nr:Uncharacterised protein [Listeria grayi]